MTRCQCSTTYHDGLPVKFVPCAFHAASSKVVGPDDFPPWTCNQCGYFNGFLMDKCGGKKGCRGLRASSALEVGKEPRGAN